MNELRVCICQQNNFMFDTGHLKVIALELWPLGTTEANDQVYRYSCKGICPHGNVNNIVNIQSENVPNNGFSVYSDRFRLIYSPQFAMRDRRVPLSSILPFD